MSHIKGGKLLATSAAVLLSIPMILPATQVKADSVKFDMSITPRCVSAADNIAVWDVNNSNPSAVNISWSNQADGQASVNTVPNGQSKMMTSYTITNPSNVTTFNWGYGDGTTNSPNTECADDVIVTDPNPAAPVNCVDVHLTDGYMQQHVKVTYLSKDTVQVDYDALDCDATINFSSYVMPAEFDGGNFYDNQTAFPQTKKDHKSFEIKAGQNGTAVMAINLPDNCLNTQTDVYFGDEIETVMENGHGTYNLGQPGFPGSQVYLSTGECVCPPEEEGGNGDGTETTPTPGQGAGTVETPAATTPATEVTPGQGAGTVTTAPTLAYTGTSPVLPYTIAAILAAFTALGTAIVRKTKI